MGYRGKKEARPFGGFSDLKKEILRFEGMRNGDVEKGYDSDWNSDVKLEGFYTQMASAQRNGPTA